MPIDGDSHTNDNLHTGYHANDDMIMDTFSNSIIDVDDDHNDS